MQVFRTPLARIACTGPARIIAYARATQIETTRPPARAPVGGPEPASSGEESAHARSTLLKQRSKKFGRQKSRFKKQRRKPSAASAAEPLAGNSRSGDPPKIRVCAEESARLDLFTLAFTLAPLAAREAPVVSIFCRHTWPLLHSASDEERLARPSRAGCSARPLARLRLQHAGLVSRSRRTGLATGARLRP